MKIEIEKKEEENGDEENRMKIRTILKLICLNTYLMTCIYVYLYIFYFLSAIEIVSFKS